MTDSIDSLLKQLNVLIQSTTDLSNHANITKVEIENLANSAKEKSVSITNNKDIITESKNQAIAAKEEILSIENQIEDKIYTDKATIIPTENKSPIAKSDGYLDQNWLESINIPSEAVSLPLKENLYLDKGKGQLDTIDLSQAQDGSQLIEIPNTDKAIVKGDYHFNEPTVKTTPVVANTFSLKNRSVSRNEKVKMAFNFYNTGEYLQIEPFNFTDNADIIIDLFLEAGGEVLGNIEKNDNLRIDKDTTTNLTRVALSIDKSFLRESLDADYTNKSLTLKLNCTIDKTEILFKDKVILTYEKKMFPVSLIGIKASSDASSLAGRYSGQIQKIEFKDLTNTDNSKVINTVIEVDNQIDSETFTYPKAEETPLKDIIKKSNFHAPFVGVKSDNTYYNGNQSTMPNSKGEKWVRGVIFKEEYNQMTTLPRGEKSGSYLAAMPFSVDSLLVANNSIVKVIKLYNALTINFEIIKGTEQSVIDDFQYPNTFIEVKSTDPNYDDYLKPEPEPEPEPEVPDTKPDIPKDNNVTTINDAEGLVLNGELIPSTEPANRSISVELGEVEYTPANPKGYTPLFDGNGRYVLLDEVWCPEGRWVIETIVTMLNPSTYGYIVAGSVDGTNSGNASATIGVQAPNKVYWAGSLEKFYLNGVEKNKGDDFTEGTHICRFEGSVRIKISHIGSRYNPKEYWKGNIVDLKFTDLSNPKNCRHYSLVEYSDTEPTTRVAIDELSRNGTVVSTPDTGNWTNYPRLNNGLLTFIEGAYFAVKIKGKFKTKPNGEFIYYHGTENTKVTLTELEFESDWLFGNPTNDKGRYGLYNNSGTNVELEHIEVLTGKHGKMIGFPETNAFIETDERPTLIADGDSVAQWAVNYDGEKEKAVVLIKQWKPAGEFRIEMDILVTRATYWHYIFCNKNKTFTVTAGYKYSAQQSGGGKLKIEVDGKEVINGTDTTIGLHKMVISGTMTSEFGPCMIGGRIDNEFDGYMEFFEGQISNLKFIDLSNPKNSRDYKGIIYSYVNPSDVYAYAPKKNLLEDSNCTPVETWDDTNVRLLRATRVNENTYNLNVIGMDNPNSSIVSGDKVTSIPILVSYTVLKNVNNDQLHFGSGHGMRAPSEVGTHSFYYVNSWGVDYTANGIGCGSPEHDITITNMSIKQLTHGVLEGFVTYYKPLLGNREVHLKPGDSAWIRGLNLNRRRMLWVWGPLSNTPDGSFLISNDKVLVTANGSNTNGGECIYSPDHGLTDDQIQKAFQYPNVFKVIKPTDPDYEFYNNLYTKKEE